MIPLRSDSRSLRVLATEAIRDLITSRELVSGDRIPGEQELVALLGTSRSTVREALKSLEHEGLLVSRQGAGTFVANRSPVAFDLTDLDFLRHTHELLAGAGLREEFPYVFIGEGVADTTAAEQLDVEVGSQLVFADRVRKINGEPIGHFRSELLPTPGLVEQLRTTEPASIREFIASLRGVRIDNSVTEIRAVPAPAEFAPLLGVPEGHPVLEQQQLRSDAEGQPVYFTRSLWRTDRITLRFTRHFHD
jgi:GntR family transcriptional regulator